MADMHIDSHALYSTYCVRGPFAASRQHLPNCGANCYSDQGFTGRVHKKRTASKLHLG